MKPDHEKHEHETNATHDAAADTAAADEQQLGDKDLDAVSGGILSSGHGTNVRQQGGKFGPRKRGSLNFEEIKVT